MQSIVQCRGTFLFQSDCRQSVIIQSLVLNNNPINPHQKCYWQFVSRSLWKSSVCPLACCSSGHQATTKVTASLVLFQNNNKEKAKVVVIMVFSCAPSSRAHLSWRTMLRVHFFGFVILGTICWDYLWIWELQPWDVSEVFPESVTIRLIRQAGH